MVVLGLEREYGDKEGVKDLWGVWALRFYKVGMLLEKFRCFVFLRFYKVVRFLVNLFMFRF